MNKIRDILASGSLAGALLLSGGCTSQNKPSLARVSQIDEQIAKIDTPDERAAYLLEEYKKEIYRALLTRDFVTDIPNLTTALQRQVAQGTEGADLVKAKVLEQLQSFRNDIRAIDANHYSQELLPKQHPGTISASSAPTYRREDHQTAIDLMDRVIAGIERDTPSLAR